MDKTITDLEDFKFFDIHMHYVPLVYKQALLKHGLANREADGLPAPVLTLGEQIKLMEKLNISKAVISLASPHTDLGDKHETVELTHLINQEGLAICNTYPDKFYLAPTLPLPYVDESCEEIEVLKANLPLAIFKLPTSASGYYLGDEIFDEIFDKLNRLNSIIILHPVSISLPGSGLAKLPGAVFNYMAETTVAITNLLVKGTLQRYKNIKLIVPHGGALLPSLYDRLIGMEALLNHAAGFKVATESFFKNLYYDLAGFAVPNQLAGLLKMTDASHLLYGSDLPYAFDVFCLKQKAALLKTELLSKAGKESVCYNNAAQLFNLPQQN